MVSSYLSIIFNFVHDISSTFTADSHSVPQSSALVIILFSLDVIGQIMCKYNNRFCSYVDDTQLYLSHKPNNSNQFLRLQACLDNIKPLMTSVRFHSAEFKKKPGHCFEAQNFINSVSNPIITLERIPLSSNAAVNTQPCF